MEHIQGSTDLLTTIRERINEAEQFHKVDVDIPSAFGPYTISQELANSIASILKEAFSIGLQVASTALGIKVSIVEEGMRFLVAFNGPLNDDTLYRRIEHLNEEIVAICGKPNHIFDVIVTLSFELPI